MTLTLVQKQETLPPGEPHHLDIDLVVLRGLLTAQPDQWLRVTSGLTGAEKIIAAVVHQRGAGDEGYLRLVFDRAITTPMFQTTIVPPEPEVPV